MSSVVPMLSDQSDDVEQLRAEQRRKALSDRLADPDVADALLSLLDHADLLAILVSGVDGLLRRGDDLSDTLLDAMTEVRATIEADDSPLAGLQLGDVTHTLRSVLALAGQAGPALDTLGRSEILSEDTMGAVGRLSGALASADADFQRGRTPSSMRRIIGGLRDKDVRAGIGYLLAVAKALGSSPQVPPRNPTRSTLQEGTR